MADIVAIVAAAVVGSSAVAFSAAWRRRVDASFVRVRVRSRRRVGALRERSGPGTSAGGADRRG